MIATVRRPIGADETSDVVERDLAHLGVAPLLSVIEQISAGTAREEPQDDSLSTYAPRLTKEEGLIDWALTATAIHNRVRGLYPWPHAYTHINGSRVIVLKAEWGLTRGQTPGRTRNSGRYLYRGHGCSRGTGHTAQAVRNYGLKVVAR